MQSLTWTGRLISRALWNSLTNNKANDPANSRTNGKEAQLFSAASGIPKDFSNHKMFQLNKYGDDAYFTARYKTADVLGKLSLILLVSTREDESSLKYSLVFFQNYL